MVQKTSINQEIFSILKHGRGKRITLPTKYVKKYSLNTGDKIRIKKFDIEIISRKKDQEPYNQENNKKC